MGWSGDNPQEKKMKKLVLALSVVGLAVAPALAQTTSTQPEFASVDADSNGQVTMEEITTAGVAMTEQEFAAADADASGWLSEEEYKTAVAG
jgi:hypothetical protein